MGRPLRDVTFCVVDLETTGGSAAQGSMITEIGAVKVRGGEVLGEFQTLVNPRSSIPPFIAVLTGISDAMVADAPPIESALPAFLEFAAGSVLVAHNAPFDVGFLKHFSADQGRDWPAFEVVDTVRLARRVVTRDETPNCKLSSLARLFRSPTEPDHRALTDARATVDVLHGLMARIGNLGVHTLEELQSFSKQVSDNQRKKRHLADAVPHAPGVYLFHDDRDTVLYVGTSKDLRTRVRSYFTSSETRTRIGEMVALADRVSSVICATPLEAQVRELRLIAAHKPRYNRRSRFPEKTHYVKVTREAWPRLSIVRTVAGDGADYLGPFSSRRTAETCVAALHESFPLRQCGGRMAKNPTLTPCALGQMGRCLSPCDGSVDPATYDALVTQVRSAIHAAPDDVIAAATRRMESLAELERFEEAALHRDRMSTYVRSASRFQRLGSLSRCPEIVAARREEVTGAGGTVVRWNVHVVRYGRLAAAGTIPPGANAHDFVRSLRASAETVASGPGPAPAASAEESERILRWLESPGVRLVEMDGEWTCPVGGAGAHLALVEQRAATDSTVPFDERGIATPVHRQVRVGQPA
ncbi:MAG: DEDD exonuclease domain-containing protein [Nocardioides sp.]|uniref:DEDD exonuclease domain-containing protein n=1 Tax=Nocardioides sp. TaxID=35761 RepID=UPI003F128867